MKKIIILEDQEAIWAVYKRSLEKSWYETVWVATINEFRLVLSRFKADVIFIDYCIKWDDEKWTCVIPLIKKILPQAYLVLLSNFDSCYLKKISKQYWINDFLLKIDMMPWMLVEYINNIKNK